MDRLDKWYARTHELKLGIAHAKGPAMNKQELVEAIQEHNSTADSEFLLSFDDTELDSYLQRLTRINNHRGRETVWVRDVDDQGGEYKRSA